MIQITIYQNQKQDIIGLSTIGHAGYDEYGHDIVCAAASILVINTINSIEKFTSDEFEVSSDEETGKIDFRFLDVPSHDADLLMKALIQGLMDMSDDLNYAEFIDVTFEEV